MNIDWDKEPKAVGALVAKISNIHYPNIEFVSEFHTFGCMFRGTSCEGQTLSASNDCWDWIPRPVPAWSGEGLPPVGMVCEVDGSAGPTGFAPCVILYSSQDVTVWKYAASDLGQPSEVEHWAAYGEREFRPIRTPEQIAAEARREALAEMTYNHENDTLIAWAIYLYDTLGYRKEVKS